MTNIERFQRLQVELVRAGFHADLHAAPSGDQAKVKMIVDLRKQDAGDIEKLDALAGGHGFSYVVGDDSHAAFTLVGDES